MNRGFNGLFEASGKKKRLNHEGHEDHEAQKQQGQELSLPFYFVLFVPFVVQSFGSSE
jgi:hypothetical protein